MLDGFVGDKVKQLGHIVKDKWNGTRRCVNDDCRKEALGSPVPNGMGGYASYCGDCKVGHNLGNKPTNILNEKQKAQARKAERERRRAERGA